MTAAETGLREGTEIERIERWRAEALERAGYSPRIAAEIAARLDIDLHGAMSLLENGCSEELAVQILL
jgi:hypothetical protein